MNLMLHIVAKDFRRLRDRLAWWLAVMVLKTAVALWLLWGPGVDDATYDHVGKVVIVLVSAEVALTFLLAAMMVQEDSLVGEQPFWRTRPISGRRLLGAKVIGLFVLLGLPVVLTALPWWLACGGRLGEIARAAGEVLLIQFVIIVPAVLMASLTETLGRFLVWSLVLLMAHAALAMMLPLLVNKSFALPAAISFARLIVYFGLVMLTGIAVVVAQYLGRSRRRSVIALALGWVVALAAEVWWPRDWKFESQTRDLPATTEAAPVAMELTGANFLRRTPRSTYENFYAHVRVTGLPAGIYLGGTKSEHHWHWSDGTEHWTRGWGISSHHIMLIAARLALQVPGTPDAAEMSRRGETRDRSIGAILHPPFGARIRSEPSRYTLTAELTVFRPEVWIEAPVQGGVWRAHSGHGLRVLRVDPPGPGDNVNASLLTTEFTTAPGGFWSFVLSAQRPDPGTVPFFLVDREQGRLKPLWQSVAGKLIIAGIEVSVPLVQLTESELLDARTRSVTVAWVGWHRGATFERTAAMERLEVE